MTYVSPRVTHVEDQSSAPAVPASPVAFTVNTGDGPIYGWDLPNRWSFLSSTEVADWTPGGTTPPSVSRISSGGEFFMRLGIDAGTSGHVAATLSGLTPGVEYVVEMLSSRSGGVGTETLVADGVSGTDLSVTFTASAAEVELRIEVTNAGSFAEVLVDRIGCRPTSGGYVSGWLSVDADPLQPGPRNIHVDTGAHLLTATLPDGFDSGVVDLSANLAAADPEWLPTEEPADVTIDPTGSFIGGSDVREGWVAFGAAGFLPKQVDPGFGVDALAIGAGAYKDLARTAFPTASISYTADAPEVSLEFLDATGTVLDSVATPNTIVDMPEATETVRMKVTATAVGFVPFSTVTLSSWTSATDGGTGAAGSDVLKMEVWIETTGQWFDILGPTHEIKVVREELNVGTLTATVLDSGLDPARGSDVKNGTAIRVTAKDAADGVFRPVYTGEITHVQTNYGHKGTRISVTASDATRVLATIGHPGGYANMGRLANECANYVPTQYNGTPAAASVEAGVFTNENASLLDQIAVTRDSLLGHAWVDAAGTLQLWDAPVLADSAPVLDTWTLTNCTLTDYYGGWVVSPAAAGDMVMRSERVSEPTPGNSFRLRTRIDWYPPPHEIDLIWFDAAGIEVSRESRVIDEKYTVTEISGVVPAGAEFAEVEIRFRNAAGGATATVFDLDLLFFNDTSGSPSAVFDENTYSAIDLGFDSDACINEITLKGLVGEEEVTIGTYTLDDSIAEWGRHPVEIRVAESVVAADPQGYVDRIFAASGFPAVRPRSIDLPVREPSDIHADRALVDLYDPVEVIYAETNTAALIRVTRIEHQIKPGKWLMRLGFEAEGAVAAPQVTPAPPPSIPQQEAVVTPFSRRYMANPSAITTNVWERVNFGTNVETVGMTEAGGVWTIDQPGIYTVFGSVSWDSNDVKRREVRFLKNGLPVANSTVPAVTLMAADATQTVATILRLAAGDTIEMEVWQNSGGDLNLTGGETLTWTAIVKSGD